MSKNSRNVKDKAAKMLKDNNKKSPVVTRKRTRGDVNVSEESQPTDKMAKRIQNSARRKIDFMSENEEHEVSKVKENVNNNATAKVSQNIELRDRNRSTKTVNKTNGIRSSDRVQWTKEFLDKIRKSNEKHERSVENKARKPKVVKTKTNQTDLSFQDQNKGDGIEMTVQCDDIEELDYEDDLSVDEDVEVVHVETNWMISPRPGTSGENRKHQGGDTIALLAEETSEAKLMNNPVIQRMMHKFFEEKFKDLQHENPGMNKVKQAGQGHIDRLKSPVDTTIYAPALQKKLTPDQNQILQHVNDRMRTQQNTSINEGNADIFPLRGNKTLNQRMNGLDIGTELRNVQLTTNEGQIRGGDYVHCGNPVDSFVEIVHAENHPEDMDVNRRKSTNVELDEARQRMDRAIVEAEKFCATIEPPGNIMNIGSGVSDDDFFHLTCYIDPTLIHKIEKGEFVELEKLT